MSLPASGSTTRPCPYCEDQAMPGCSECSGTGIVVTTYMPDGSRVTGNAVPEADTLAAFDAVIQAAHDRLREDAPYPTHCICPCGRGTNPGCQVCP